MVKRAKSSLKALLGEAGRKAFERHKNDETRYSSTGQLPPGIEGGIAKLVDCKIDTYKEGNFKGKPYFYAAGVVVRPKEHNGVPVEGLRTQIMEPLCETPNRTRKTVEDHISWVCNELRKLGVDTSELSFDDLEDAIEALREEGPYFRFRTWQGRPTEQFPNPTVRHEWNGRCDFESDESEEEEAVVDETEEPEEEQDIPFGDELDMLADRANDGDEEAMDELVERAKKAGLSQEEVDEMMYWSEVADAIREREKEAKAEEEEPEEELEDEEEEELEDEEEEPGDEEEDEEEEELIPEKGETYYYKPPKARKRIEVEVTAVFHGKQTCNVRSTASGKLYRGVPFTALEVE